MTNEEFLLHVNQTDEEVRAARLTVGELLFIYDDYKSRYDELLRAGEGIQSSLRVFKGVHSTRLRVKTPISLVRKIVRKCTDNKERTINRDNYLEEVRDLIRLRALHLFKEDWNSIHKEIKETWDLHPKEEKPIAYYREGDSDKLRKQFEDADCDSKSKEAGYRSIHYLIVARPNKRSRYYAEIQVRTIFEEAWSEIDHQIRYPDHTDSTLLKEFLLVFNRIAGGADEMASFLLQMKAEIEVMSLKTQQLKKEKQEIEHKLEEANIELEKIGSKSLDASSIAKIQENISSVIKDLRQPHDVVPIILLQLAEQEKRMRALKGNTAGISSLYEALNKIKDHQDVFLEQALLLQGLTRQDIVSPSSPNPSESSQQD